MSDLICPVCQKVIHGAPYTDDLRRLVHRYCRKPGRKRPELPEGFHVGQEVIWVAERHRGGSRLRIRATVAGVGSTGKVLIDVHPDDDRTTVAESGRRQRRVAVYVENLMAKGGGDV